MDWKDIAKRFLPEKEEEWTTVLRPVETKKVNLT